MSNLAVPTLPDLANLGAQACRHARSPGIDDPVPTGMVSHRALLRQMSGRSRRQIGPVR